MPRPPYVKHHSLGALSIEHFLGGVQSSAQTSAQLSRDYESPELAAGMGSVTVSPPPLAAPPPAAPPPTFDIYTSW